MPSLRQAWLHDLRTVAQQAVETVGERRDDRTDRRGDDLDAGEVARQLLFEAGIAGHGETDQLPRTRRFQFPVEGVDGGADRLRRTPQIEVAEGGEDILVESGDGVDRCRWRAGADADTSRQGGNPVGDVADAVGEVVVDPLDRGAPR